MHHLDYIDAGFKVFGLHGVENGVCGCGNPECKALFKHPRTSSWQHTPDWSDEQLEFMEEYGHFDTGFGVLVSGYLIIDIDPRNGGDINAIPDEWRRGGCVVATGGGGWHIYFKSNGDALKQHLNEYQGIDFKSSGYVVGAGSVHASGCLYEIESGSLDSIGDAPKSLLLALKKDNYHRAQIDGGIVDITDQEIVEMLGFIDPSCSYDQWIKIGMAIHQATNRGGLGLWDSWSSRGDSYDGALDKHWHSFGKCSNPVSLGTLIHFAEEGGYKQSVTFESDVCIEDEKQSVLDVSGVDLLRPPGFVGEVTSWINDQCRYPRERLAVGAALSAIGNIAGLRYEDEEYGVTSNQFIFCVGGSATGKEAIQQAQTKIHIAAGVSGATHGAIKSEQEITRNLVDNQASFYIIDEIGIFLRKLANATRRGSASYLEGVIGMLMSSYSKANGKLLLTGDTRKEIKSKLEREYSEAKRKIDENEDKGGYYQSKKDRLETIIPMISHGLNRPFVSLIGYTTPVTFDEVVDYEQSANGFIGRSLIIKEADTNPKAKRKFKPLEMSQAMDLSLKSLYAGGQTMDDNYVCQSGELVKVPTANDALLMLDEIQDYFHSYAESIKSTSLEAVPRRAFELVLKISLVLSIPEGLRTTEHVRWAFAMVKNDVETKINMAASKMAEESKRNDEALIRKIVGLLDRDHGEKTGVIINRCRPFRKEDVIKALDLMEEKGIIRKEEKKKTKSYYEYFLEKDELQLMFSE